MDFDLARQAMQIALDRQSRYDFVEPTMEKVSAKADARDTLVRHLKGRGFDPAECSVLDVGHEEFYAPLFRGTFRALYAANLPDADIHDLKHREVPAICAMHVLEHSPFPLLALLSMRRCLSHGGVSYVSVPIATKPFTEDPCHFSVLDRDQWRKVFGDAGFEVIEESQGRFNDYMEAFEWRFVLA